MPTTNPATIGRVIHLPAAGGADDRFRAGQPLGSGSLQILRSNIEILARENACRTLWEFPGEGNIAGTLGYGVSAGAGSVDPTQFDWDADPTDSTTVRSWFAGVHRVRPYGSTGALPLLRLSGYASCGGVSTAGIIIAARSGPGRPRSTDPYAVATVTSTTLQAFDATLELLDAHLGQRLVAPLDATAVPAPPPAESGRETVVYLWVGAWTDGTGKTNVRGLTLSLIPPAGYP